MLSEWVISYLFFISEPSPLKYFRPMLNKLTHCQIGEPTKHGIVTIWGTLFTLIAYCLRHAYKLTRWNFAHCDSLLFALIKAVQLQSQHVQRNSDRFITNTTVSLQTRQWHSKYYSFIANTTVSQQTLQFHCKHDSVTANTAVSLQTRHCHSKCYSFTANTTLSQQIQQIHCKHDRFTEKTTVSLQTWQ